MSQGNVRSHKKCRESKDFKRDENDCCSICGWWIPEEKDKKLFEEEIKK